MYKKNDFLITILGDLLDKKQQSKIRRIKKKIENLEYRKSKQIKNLYVISLDRLAFSFLILKIFALLLMIDLV